MTMNPNFYVESSVNVENNDNTNVYRANFYTESRSNPNFYVEDNADDHHCMPSSSQSCLTKTSMHENIGQSTSMTKARNRITHSMKDKSTSSRPEPVSRRNLFKIRPIKYNCESPPLMRPVQVLVKAKNVQSNNILQDMGDKLESILMPVASGITQSGRDNSTSSPLMKPAQQSPRNSVTAKNAKSNSIHSMHHNMGYKLQSATISEELNMITHSVRNNSTSSPLEPEQVSHRNLVETKSTESNSSSSRLSKLVQRLHRNLVKAKHTKSNGSCSRLMRLIHEMQSDLVKAKQIKSNRIHSMNHTMVAHKLQSSSMTDAVNGLTQSVRHNSTSSPLMTVVSHRNLVKAKNERQEEVHQPIGHDLHEFVAHRPADNNNNNNKSYESKRKENNIASQQARKNRKKREAELSNKVLEAEELNRQVHAELDEKYKELSRLMYLIAVVDGKA